MMTPETPSAEDLRNTFDHARVGPVRRVLSVVHYPDFGGQHNQSLRLAKPLLERGWEVLVLLPSEPGSAVARLNAAGVRTVTIPLHRLRETFNPIVHLRLAFSLWREVSAIRRVLRENRIDLVLIHGLVNPHAAFAARLEGIPIVWQLLDTRPPMLVRRAFMPLVTRLADVVMSTGVQVARVHPGAIGMGERLVPYFPPVDTREFRPDPARRSAARARLGIPDDFDAIGTVANSNPQKGLEYLIWAAALVYKAWPKLSVRLLAARLSTHGDYQEMLCEEARRSGLTENDHIRFDDPEGQVSELMPALDVFLLTSVPRSEGVPTVVLEAMACQLPVVTTDTGAVSEVVEDGVTGFVVAPLDTEAIARATLRLLQDAPLRARMGDEARRRAVERYDVESCADSHLHAFDLATRT
jgi:glycosyltransferase involved in cell wall biosynthesis